MNPQLEAKPTPKLPPQTRLISVSFLQSVHFLGESMSARLASGFGFGGGALAAVDSITPARLDFDGQAVPIEKGQRADGLLLMRKGAKCFVGMVNVGEIAYGE
jgi:hypothetical protein